MMFLKNMKLMFYTNIVLCAAFLKNISPSHAIEDKTPNEMWFGYLPSLKDLIRFFGSTCYALIPKEQRNKLGAKIQRYIFLGH